MNSIEKFRQFMETKGMRLTREREWIAEQIFASGEQFDSEQLVFSMIQKNTDRKVSRSTLYRTLGWLTDAGLIRKISRTNDKDVYEIILNHPRFRW